MSTSPDPKAELTARLRRHVDRLAGLIGPRHLGRPQALNAAIGLIEQEFSAAGYVTRRLPYPIHGQKAVNLVAELPGTDRAQEIVVLGAHYDTVEGTPDADDNASAVAVLLEVARLLRPLKPRRTVRFVAFACEEPPYFCTDEMGSQVYARQCRERGDRIVGMLCLEMVGFYSVAVNSQNIPEEIPRALHWALPHRGDFLAAVGNLRSWRLVWGFRRGFKRTVRFPLFSIALPEAIRAIRLSDSSSFWDQGYSALMLTDTSFLRNPHYHMPSDMPETLDYDRMADVAVGVAGAVAHLARAEGTFRV
jgi:Zn-dependent M28 family amino/carboxypeptidase